MSCGLRPELDLWAFTLRKMYHIPPNENSTKDEVKPVPMALTRSTIFSTSGIYRNILKLTPFDSERITDRFN
jgi:hypothetical protein